MWLMLMLEAKCIHIDIRFIGFKQYQFNKLTDIGSVVY